MRRDYAKVVHTEQARNSWPIIQDRVNAIIAHTKDGNSMQINSTMKGVQSVMQKQRRYTKEVFEAGTEIKTPTP
jgi:hypothetical protein